MNRENADQFLLERRGAWHLGTFVVPAGLITGAGLMLLEVGTPGASAPDKLDGLGQDRTRWRTALRSAVPLVPEALPEGALSELIAAVPGDISAVHPRGRVVHQSRWHSPNLGVDIRAWLAPAARTSAYTLLLTDGGEYFGSTPIMPALDASSAPPTDVLAFGPAEREAREAVLGTDKLALFIDKELLPWARTVHPITGELVIAGGSLGGLAAARLVRTRPDLVPNAIVQSAAFWWPDYTFAELEAWKRKAQGDETGTNAADASAFRVFAEVGAYEGFLRKENRKFAALLPATTAFHHTREYPGGHDYVCWRAGIIDGLQWLADTHSAARDTQQEK